MRHGGHRVDAATQGLRGLNVNDVLAIVLIGPELGSASGSASARCKERVTLVAIGAKQRHPLVLTFGAFALGIVARQGGAVGGGAAGRSPFGGEGLGINPPFEGGGASSNDASLRSVRARVGLNGFASLDVLRRDASGT